MKKLIPLSIGLTPGIFGFLALKLYGIFPNYLLILLPITSILFLAYWYLMGYIAGNAIKKPSLALLFMNIPMAVMLIIYIFTESITFFASDIVYSFTLPMLGLVIGMIDLIPSSWLVYLICFVPVLAVSWLGCCKACYPKNKGE